MSDTSISYPNEWVDFKEGDVFPVLRQFVRALNRPLKTPQGFEDQFVALSYLHGSPLLGRAWKEADKIKSSFMHNNREFCARSLGKLQLLEQMPANTTGFVYEWKPFGTVSKLDNKECQPLHISFVVPCVLLIVVDKENYELLGSANIKEENAHATTSDGKIIKFSGYDIQKFPVLCRRSYGETMDI